jgi:hypothetical protein
MGTGPHLRAMRSAMSSRQSPFRRWWAIVLVVAMTLAPTLMHGGGAQASPASHHGGGQVTSATTLHEHGHHEHMADPRAAEKAETQPLAAAGACLFCVICAGAADLGPALVAPAWRHLSLLPVSLDSLVARDPAPGYRPPLI